MTEFNNVTEGLHKELSFSNNEYKKWLGNLDNEVIDKSKKIKFRKIKFKKVKKTKFTNYDLIIILL